MSLPIYLRLDAPLKYKMLQRINLLITARNSNEKVLPNSISNDKEARFNKRCVPFPENFNSFSSATRHLGRKKINEINNYTNTGD